MWPSTVFLSDEDCEHCKGGAQHLSRKPKFSSRFLAATWMGPRWRQTSPRIRGGCHCRAKGTNAGRLNGEARFEPRKRLGLESSRSSFLDAAPRGQINRKAPKPMSAFVVCAGDRCNSGAAMLVRRR